MIKRTVLLLCLLIGSCSMAADLILALEGKNKVSFKAIGRPKSLTVVGEGGSPKGELVFGAQTRGTCSFDLATLTTGIGLRDTHMKEKYLEVAKFPVARLDITELKAPPKLGTADFSEASVPFSGKLSLHGIEKMVTGEMKLKRSNDLINSLTTFGLKLSDFGIGIPSFAGITIADSVDVTVDVTGPLVEKR